MTMGVFLSWILKLTVAPYVISLVLGSRSRGHSLTTVLLLLGLVGVSALGIALGYVFPLNPAVWTVQGVIALLDVSIFGYALAAYGFSGESLPAGEDQYPIRARHRNN